MDQQTVKKLRIGAWCVDPVAGQISRDGETARLDARTMRLLLCLAEHDGEAVSIDDLLKQVWPDVTVTSDSVYQAIASLRRVLRDDAKQPAYIVTVPRMGYRMIAKVGVWSESPLGEPAGVGIPSLNSAKEKSVRSRRAGLLWIAVVGVLALVYVVRDRVFHEGSATNNSSASPVMAAQSEKSIAVLPFLNLTEGMKDEEFADGMTEELIDKLSKIPGIRVPSATSSFYFKNKQVAVAEIGKALGVAYVLDGSVRKAGGRLRIAARLARAEDGFVIWSETYDRLLVDRVMVQDEIAGEVTKALKASIDARP